MRGRFGRRWVLVGGAILAVIALNVVGVLRYPGGPLREPSADGLLWLDVRPADQGSSTVGNTAQADWAMAGRSYYFGTLSIHNPTGFDATVEAVTPVDPTPGLVVDAGYAQRPGMPGESAIAFGPAGSLPDDATLAAFYDRIPVIVPPSGESHERDARFLLVLRSGGPGAFGFSALAVDYRIGPLTFHSIHHLALAGCLGPLPVGAACPGM